MRILLLDNYDSFTYNLKHYIEAGGAECFVLRNDDASLLRLKSGDLDGIVLSPGPQTPTEAGYLMRFIQGWLYLKPVLGVCLGHQAMGMHFGASLSAAKEPVHGKVKTLEQSGHIMFDGMPAEFKVCRYHSLILTVGRDDFPFEITARCGEEIMAIAHKRLPLWGVQYHPEAILTEHGQKLINNWLKLVRNTQQN